MLSEEEKAEIRAILASYLDDELVQSMKQYIQHGSVTTYEHCLAVVYKSYEVARDTGALGRINLPATLRAALLHDFYLYDWHEKDKSHALHGYHHARRAMNNARERFGIGGLEQSIIFSHMWPLNITRIPKTREAWIVTIADKIVATSETIHGKIHPRKAQEQEETPAENKEFANKS